MRINVTKTFFPPLEEYQAQLKRIWANEWLTNRGELVLELECQLKTYLNSTDLIIMNNGTVPLQIALKLLGKGGEIITTPFSYVATSSTILWEHCTPVFVDIDPEYLTIDETLIEEAITDKTTCILATHVFGNPCNVEAIDIIAKKHNLKVIYDAAHCFGVNYKGKSIFNYGDVSTCSFHATKVFHTGEGGALFTSDKTVFHQAFYSHNFGHNGPLDFYGLGINGKISELQAAMGLAVLPHMSEIFEARKQVVDFYNEHLDKSKLQTLKIRPETEWNYSYYPVVFQSEKALLNALEQLNSVNIFPRRYFYPSLNTIPFISGKEMPNSESNAKRIMCLPLASELNFERLTQIINFIK